MVLSEMIKGNFSQLFQGLAIAFLMVFAVGLVSELESGKRSKATKLMKALADETGGRVVFVESRSSDIDKQLSDLAIPQQ